MQVCDEGAVADVHTDPAPDESQLGMDLRSSLQNTSTQASLHSGCCLCTETFLVGSMQKCSESISFLEACNLPWDKSALGPPTGAGKNGSEAVKQDSQQSCTAV